MGTTKTKKEIDDLQKQIKQKLKKLEGEKKPPTPPTYTKGQIYEKDLKFGVLLTKFIFLCIVTLIFWIFTNYLLTGPLTSGKLLIGILSGVSALIVTLLFVKEGIKLLPLLIFKLNEDKLKDLLKITMFTLTGKLKVFYVKPSIDADFTYKKGIYVVDDNAKYWDGNYHNSFYIQGLPAPLTLKRKSSIKEYYESAEKIKNILNGEGTIEDIERKDIENIICFSHSANQLGEYKKDKLVSDLHRSSEGDKILMAVIGMAVTFCVCMVAVFFIYVMFG